MLMWLDREHVANGKATFDGPKNDEAVNAAVISWVRRPVSIQP